MSRGAQALVVVLLVAVVAMGGALVARNRRGAGEGRAAPPPANTLVAFAPCGMSGPINLATALFRQKHPEVALEVVYDNANVLVRRVLNQGERPDVFLSPGEVELKQIAAKGLVDPASVRDFGTLDMVLIAPRSNMTVTGLSDLGSPKVNVVSMGDPAFNSVGYYGAAALRSLNLWKTVEPKLVLREFPLEAFKLVEQGRADAGLAYLTCPLDTAPEKADKQSVRIVERIPRDKYPPVRLQVGTLKSSKQRAGAKLFTDFMVSPEAQQAMSKDGLRPIEVKP